HETARRCCQRWRCRVHRRAALGYWPRMAPFIAAGAGFLLAVLWFDLMFDVQVARGESAELSEHVLSSIANYYRRVTTTARPMNRLVAAVMLTTLGSIIAQIARG